MYVFLTIKNNLSKRIHTYREIIIYYKQNKITIGSMMYFLEIGKTKKAHYQLRNIVH